jgi:hypothetical protein
MKSIFALAVLAAIGFTGTAFAEDATKGWTATTGPAAMSDSQMDKVTAGVQPDGTGLGQITAFGGIDPDTGLTVVGRANESAGGPHSPPTGKGLGTATENGPASPVH